MMPCSAQARFLTEFSREENVTPLALNYDFGLLTLASPAPDGTAHMDIQPGSGSAVIYGLTTAGYPADKPAQTMWQVGRPCADPVHLMSLLHQSPLPGAAAAGARTCCAAGWLPKRAV